MLQWKMTLVFPEVEVLESVQVDTAYTQHGLQAVLHVDSNKMRKEFFVRLTRLMEVVFASLKLVDNLV